MHGVQAQLLDRTRQHDLLAVEAEAGLGGGIGRVTGGDGAIERTGIRSGADDDELLPVELGGECVGLFLGFEVAGFELRLALLEGLDVDLVGAQGLFSAAEGSCGRSRP